MSNPNHRLEFHQAEFLLQHFPPHRWYKKSLYWLLEQEDCKKNLPNIPLNKRLLESLKTNGFMSPFLCMEKWYPICGSQRARAALELSEEVQKRTIINICHLDHAVWMPFYFWGNKEEGHRSSQIFIQMLEKVFKTLYMPPTDREGTDMILFEIEGDQLHWECRDGPKVPNS